MSKFYTEYASVDYVNKTVNDNKIITCTDEEFDTIVASNLVVSEDNDDLVFLEEPQGE